MSSGGCDLVTRTGITELSVLHVDDEMSLLEEVVKLVTTWDPDMLVGYEVKIMLLPFHQTGLIKRLCSIG